MIKDVSKLILLSFILLLVIDFSITDAQFSWDVRIESVNFVSQANTPVYPGSKNAELRVEVKFFVNATRPVGTLSILPRGITPSYGFGISVSGTNSFGVEVVRVREGETVHFVYKLNVDKDVSPGSYLVNFQLSFIDDDGQTKMYYLWFEINISSYPDIQLEIVNAKWSPAGYNGTYGTSLEITLLNKGESIVYSSDVKLVCPEEITCRNVDYSILNLNPGQRISIVFSPLDIPESTLLGDYSFSLIINATMMTLDGVTYSSNSRLMFSLRVEEAPPWMRQIKIIQAVWGQVSPQPAYEDSLYIPLTITYFNNGPYIIESLLTVLDSEQARFLQNSSSSSAPIDVGGSMSLTYYVSVDKDKLSKQEIVFTVYIWYTLNLGGNTYLVLNDKMSVKLGVENYPKSNAFGVSITFVGWQNNYAVYPNTNNAVLILQLSNNLPFTIVGLNSTMILPDGFSFDGKRTWTYYHGSPLQPYGSIQASFSIDVEDIAPGDYKAFLIVEYVIQSGGPGKRIIDIHELNLTVSSFVNPVEIINTKWSGGSPDTYFYGANLLISIRNRELDVINNPVLVVELPPGITFSYTNTSIAAVLPGTVQTYEVPRSLTGLEDIIQFLDEIQRQQTTLSKTTYGKGESMMFALPLNLMLEQTGTYYATGKLSFIDQWGSYREITLNIPIIVLGSPKYIEVNVEGSLSAKNRYNNATLIIKNIGSSSIHNIYISIMPPNTLLSGQQSTVLLVSPSTYYIDDISPNSEKRIPITFVFNPLSLQSAYGLTTIMNYGVVPLEVTLVYKDPTGSQKTFKNYIAIAVEPFIEIVLSDIKAQLLNNTLKISGTIINYGSATAYRLSIKAVVGDYESTFFVGDLDAGSSNAFRIDKELPPGYKPNIAYLHITYYNAFNEQLIREIPVSIMEYVYPTQTTIQREQTLVSRISIYGLLVMVALFVLISGILIFRLYRSHMKKLESAENK